MHQKRVNFEKLYYPITDEDYKKYFNQINLMDIKADYKAAKWKRLLSAKLLTEKKKGKIK